MADQDLGRQELLDTITRLERQVTRLKTGQCCTICTDFYCMPYTLACGHSFCYECLLEWFGTAKVSKCPTCNTVVQQRPVVSVALQQQVEDNDDMEGYEERLSRARRIAKRKGQDIWDQWLVKDAVFDDEDGVMRCYECMFEIVNGRCINCGITLQVDDHSSDTSSNDGLIDEVASHSSVSIDDESEQGDITDFIDDCESIIEILSSDEEAIEIKSSDGEEDRTIQNKKRRYVVDSD